VGGVAVAVTLVIFVSGLITGLQQRLVNVITGSIAHVTVQAPERQPRIPEQIPGTREGTVVLAKSEDRPWQPDTIDQCRCLERELSGLAHVIAVSPGVGGTALITAGGSEASVRVLGALPLQQNQISSGWQPARETPRPSASRGLSTRARRALTGLPSTSTCARRRRCSARGRW
jgi:ABC-type lipoprotein release transport system permease subunit